MNTFYHIDVNSYLVIKLEKNFDLWANWNDTKKCNYFIIITFYELIILQ